MDRRKATTVRKAALAARDQKKAEDFKESC